MNKFYKIYLKLYLSSENKCLIYVLFNIRKYYIIARINFRLIFKCSKYFEIELKKIKEDIKNIRSDFRMSNKEFKQTIRKEDKKFYKEFKTLSPERVIQIAFMTLSGNYLYNLEKNTVYTDNFKIKEINSLVKRTEKIGVKLVELIGNLDYHLNKNQERINHVLNLYDGKMKHIVNSKILDIDNDEDKVIKDIFDYWYLAVHCFYQLKIIDLNLKYIENIELKNLIKGFLLSAKGFNNYLIKELKSDEIFIKGEC